MKLMSLTFKSNIKGLYSKQLLNCRGPQSYSKFTARSYNWLFEGNEFINLIVLKIFEA